MAGTGVKIATKRAGEENSVRNGGDADADGQPGDHDLIKRGAPRIVPSVNPEPWVMAVINYSSHFHIVISRSLTRKTNSGNSFLLENVWDLASMELLPSWFSVGNELRAEKWIRERFSIIRKLSLVLLELHNK